MKLELVDREVKEVVGEKIIKLKGVEIGYVEVNKEGFFHVVVYPEQVKDSPVGKYSSDSLFQGHGTSFELAMKDLFESHTKSLNNGLKALDLLRQQSEFDQEESHA